MDIASLIGLIAGFVVIFMGMFSQPIPIGSWLSIESIYITIGGHIFAYFLAYPMKKIMNTFNILGKVFSEPKIDYIQLIETLVEKSEKARRDGLLALDDETEDLPDEFLKKGIRLVVDGTEPELVKDVLYQELDKLEERHARAADQFTTLSVVAPAFGLIGTLIGLIAMLGNLGGDKSVIGIGMSTADYNTLWSSFS
jgi:chemotaxis protein MotA